MPFSNDQWKVTADGLETIEQRAGYFIATRRLTETTDQEGVPCYDWPLQMAAKTWVDLPAFLEAFEEALRIHAGSYSPPLDPTMLALSARLARRNRAKGER